MHAFPCAVHVSLHCATPKEELKDKVRRYERTDDKRLRARLRELENEWDSERAFEAGAAGLVLLGILLGTVHCKKWLLISAAAGALMLERALQGWSPMQPVLKRCGVRTQTEIEAEKDAIRSILSQRAEDAQASSEAKNQPESQNAAEAAIQQDTPPERYPESTGE